MSAIDLYAGCGREPVRVFDSFTKRMQELGFQKVSHRIVYAGPVAQLIDELKAAGWTQEEHERNPFLLRNPGDTHMLVNYAASNTHPDDQYLSYF